MLEFLLLKMIYAHKCLMIIYQSYGHWLLYLNWDKWKMILLLQECSFIYQCPIQLIGLLKNLYCFFTAHMSLLMATSTFGLGRIWVLISDVTCSVSTSKVYLKNSHENGLCVCMCWCGTYVVCFGCLWSIHWPKEAIKWVSDCLSTR